MRESHVGAWLGVAGTVLVVAPLTGCLTASLTRGPLPAPAGPGGAVSISVFDSERAASKGRLTERPVATALYRREAAGERLVQESLRPHWWCGGLEPGAYRLHIRSLEHLHSDRDADQVKDEEFEVQASREVHVDIVLRNGSEEGAKEVSTLARLLAVGAAGGVAVHAGPGTTIRARWR